MSDTKHIVILLIAIILCASRGVSAQNTLWDVFEKIKKANKADAITYTYRVYMVNKASGVAEDSIKGIFFKHKHDYLDSNSTQLTTFDGKHYCKLDFIQQTAMVYDANYLKGTLGLSIDSSNQNIISIPDSIIIKYGNVKIDFPKDRNVIVARITFEEQVYSSIAVELDKNSYRIITMKLETDLAERMNGDDYKKVYIIEKVNYSVNAGKINMERFVTARNGKVALTNKYAKYKLTSLTN